MRLESLKALIIGIMVLWGGVHAVAQESESTGIVGDSKRSQVFKCEPGSIPPTSILEETRNKIGSILDPGYENRYPGLCRSWTKRYLAENGEDRYTIEVVKYVGDGWEALVKVKRNGEGVAYADVDMESKNLGSTDAHGRLRTELPDSFHILVETIDGELHLRGETG